jgi:hypothetical protein
VPRFKAVYLILAQGLVIALFLEDRFNDLSNNYGYGGIAERFLLEYLFNYSILFNSR